jgi:hypothetical protein
MIARISTYLPCSNEQLWAKIVEPKSLQFVASPILKFIPIGKNSFDKEWEVKRDYVLKLYLFGFLPLGNHTIRLINIDRSENKIESTESGLLARVWNHTIQFQEIEENRIYYTDTIEIKAGLLTPMVWSFAQLFYRHRQRRWRKLLKQ